MGQVQNALWKSEAENKTLRQRLRDSASEHETLLVEQREAESYTLKPRSASTQREQASLPAHKSPPQRSPPQSSFPAEQQARSPEVQASREVSRAILDSLRETQMALAPPEQPPSQDARGLTQMVARAQAEEAQQAPPPQEEERTEDWDGAFLLDLKNTSLGEMDFDGQLSPPQSTVPVTMMQYASGPPIQVGSVPPPSYIPQAGFVASSPGMVGSPVRIVSAGPRSPPMGASYSPQQRMVHSPQRLPPGMLVVSPQQQQGRYMVVSPPLSGMQVSPPPQQSQGMRVVSPQQPQPSGMRMQITSPSMVHPHTYPPVHPHTYSPPPQALYQGRQAYVTPATFQ